MISPFDDDSLELPSKVKETVAYEMNAFLELIQIKRNQFILIESLKRSKLFVLTSKRTISAQVIKIGAVLY